MDPAINDMTNTVAQVTGWDPQTIALWVGAVVGVITHLSTRLPNSSNNKFVNLVLKLVNKISGNYGTSANDPAKE
jgi:hypothetical protein